MADELITCPYCSEKKSKRHPLMCTKNPNRPKRKTVTDEIKGDENTKLKSEPLRYIKPELEEPEQQEEPETEMQEEYIPPPNKIGLAFGDLAVNIESIDLTTSQLCEGALEVLNRMIIRRYGVAVQQEGTQPEADIEDNRNSKEPAGGDLDSQKEYERLMDNIR